jgi:multiple sugar transport system substrate-binding protein
MFKRTSRAWAPLAALSLALPLLAACGGDTAPAATNTAVPAAAGVTAAPTTAAPAAGGQKATLTFWNGFTGPDRPAVEALVKKFNDANPDIQVQMDITPWDSLMQKLLSTMSTGQGPDITGIHFQYLPQYAKSGYVMDLSSVYKAGGDLDPANFPPALVDLLKYQGKFYAAPMNFATLLMYYNKDLFKAAGLDPEKPPATWDEWTADIKKLTKPDTGQYGIAIGEHDTIPNWPIFIWGNGGDVVKDGKAMLSDPKSQAALQQWGDLVTKDKVSPTGLSGAEADKLFQSQKAAMEISGPWLTNGFTDAKINFGVAPIPVGPGGPVTLADSVVMMVNKSSKNTDAAIKFVNFWNSKDSQLYFSTQTGFPSARLDLASDPALAQNPWSPKFAAVAPTSRFYLGGLEKFAQIDTDVFTPMIQQITLGKQSVADATKAADAKITDLLK